MGRDRGWERGGYGLVGQFIIIAQNSIYAEKTAWLLFGTFD